MQVKLQKVGNSIGTTFPKEILDKLDWQEGDALTLVEVEDGIKLIASEPECEQKFIDVPQPIPGAKQYVKDAQAAYDNQDFEAALEQLKLAIALQPDNFDYYVGQASCYQELGDLDSALRAMEQAIQLAPEFAQLYNIRGQCHAEKLDYDAATNDFIKAIRLDPQAANYYLEEIVNTSYYHPKQYVKILEPIDFAIEQQLQNDCKIYILRGRVHLYYGALNEALEDFRKAVEIATENNSSSDRSLSLCFRSSVYHELGDYASAIEDINRSISSNPKERVNYYWLAFYYLGMGNLSQSLEQMLNLLDTDSQTIERAYTLVWLGVINKLQNDRVLAVKQWGEAIELSGSIDKETSRLRLKGLLLSLVGSREDAIKQYKLSFDKKPILMDLFSAKKSLSTIKNLFPSDRNIQVLYQWFMNYLSSSNKLD